MNIELRGTTYYATLLVPEDVREAIGRTRFKKSLKTGNRRDALHLAAPYVAHWKALIRQARGSTNAVEQEAVRWKKALEGASDGDTLETIELALTSRAEEVERTKGTREAKEFHDVASGRSTPSSQYFDAWTSQIKLVAKTKDQMTKDVRLLVAKFPSLEGIARKSVRLWIDELQAEGKGDASIRRILSFCRNYWKYLKKYEAVERDSTPFDDVFEPATKAKRKTTNFAYSRDDVVRLWQQASTRPFGKAINAKPDKQLAALVLLGAYTGARIEELCSMKVEKVTNSTFIVEDAKTLSGWREFPIHSAIAPLVKELKEASKDGYLISGLTFNKYKDRSNAIGKRYGRLKSALGFSGKHTFHSFRSTVATLLQNAGVPESVAADIVGHDKPSMTYGLYSDGAFPETMREALEKISYPFPERP